MRSTKLQELAGPPELAELDEDYQWCLNRRSLWDRRARINRDSRYCQWAGQSDDGRKWTPRSGETEVRPWKGASDSRPHLVDTYIREDAAKLLVIRNRAKILVSGTEANDAEFGTRLTQLLRWRHTQMTERRREIRLAANWQLERGAVAVGCWWKKETALGYEEVDMETFQARAMLARQFLNAGQAPEGFDEETLIKPVFLYDAILDPARLDEAVELFLDYYEDVKKPDAAKAITSLRETGHARFKRPYLRVDRPCIGARAIGEEIFLPEDAMGFDDTRSVHERKLLTESQLREHAISHGWNQAWVDEVVETQRGVVTMGLNRAAEQRYNNSVNGLSILDLSKRYEILCSHRRLADEEGVIGIYYTVWHAGMTAKSSRRRREIAYGYHDLLNYDHGEMPYTLFQTEMRSRVVDDARGYGEVASTWQGHIKGGWDQRLDAASISTLRPWFCPPDEEPEGWGPGVRIPTSRPQAFGFFDGVEYTPHGEKAEEMVMRHADRYFGRTLADGTNAVAAGALDQDLADEWMGHWAKVDTQQLKLEQQFAPDEIYFRVVGDAKATPLHATRDEIQGGFDVSITYNTSMMDMEYVKEVFNFVNTAMQWDRGGRIDADELVGFGFDLVDPNLGQRVLKAPQEASGAELDDERNVLNSLLNGVPVDVREGQAYQMRLQWLQQELQQNKKAQKLYMEDEAVKEAIEERVKQLNHQVEQQTTNVRAGQLGGLPANARARK